MNNRNDYLLVGYVGKTPNGSVYHSLCGTRSSQVQNLSGANFRPLCGDVSAAKVSNFDAIRANLSGCKYCKNCRKVISEYKKIAKSLRYVGKMPENNYTEFFEGVRTYSLVGLRIQLNRTTPEGFNRSELANI